MVPLLVRVRPVLEGSAKVDIKPPSDMKAAIRTCGGVVAAGVVVNVMFVVV